MTGEKGDVLRCYVCRELLPAEMFAIDSGKAGGRKSICLECDREKSRAYYLERRAKNQPVSEEDPPLCSECGVPLEGRRRVICGKSSCRERRFKRLRPEAYAARESAKVERRRAARAAARQNRPVV